MNKLLKKKKGGKKKGDKKKGKKAKGGLFADKKKDVSFKIPIFGGLTGSIEKGEEERGRLGRRGRGLRNRLQHQGEDLQ